MLDADADPDADAMVEAAVAGDETAWQALWEYVEPRLLRVVAQPHFLGRISRREDDRRDIVVDVMARLRAGDFYRLKHYLAARRDNPALSFMTWLRVVAKRVGIDYMRAHPDYVDGRGRGEQGAWIAPVTLPPPSRLPGARPPVTNRATAQVLLRAAADGASTEQVEALAHWLHGEPTDLRLVRAAVERLRRRFRAAGTAG